MTRFNDARTRAVTEEAFGIACYEGAVHDGQFFGFHRGIVGEWADAEAWLRGLPAPLVTIYADEHMPVPYPGWPE